jgi:hypothetical protein
MIASHKVAVLSAVSLSLLVSAALVRAADAPAKKPYWKITGALEEACSCSAACPCWFDSLPTRSMCSGSQVLFIEKGKYGDVPLNGLAVANMAQSPDGKTMMESFGKWNFSYLYIDEKATPAQREALLDIGKTVLPFAGSTKTEIRYSPITQTIEGKEHKISLGQYGQFHGHLIEGGLGGTSKITNPPGADPLHHEYLQGRTSVLTYTDADQNWNYKDSNYMQGRFTIDSKQYEKYMAGLAQKMAGMNK